jgi:hypothetical protein
MPFTGRSLWAGGDNGLIRLSPVANLRMLDIRVVDVFQPPGKPGYVLDFSDRTFVIFFAQELNVEIDILSTRQTGRDLKTSAPKMLFTHG